jgi:hypothetical protein
MIVFSFLLQLRSEMYWDKDAFSPSLSRLNRLVWAQVPAILVAGCRKPKQGT